MKHNIGDEGMATGLDLSGIQQFNPYEDPTMLSNRQTVWLKRFERFVVAMDIKDTTRKHSLLAPMLKRFSKLSRIAKKRTMMLLPRN